MNFECLPSSCQAAVAERGRDLTLQLAGSSSWPQAVTNGDTSAALGVAYTFGQTFSANVTQGLIAEGLCEQTSPTAAARQARAPAARLCQGAARERWLP